MEPLELVLIAVAAVIVIAVVTALSQRTRVAGPLILVVIGIGVSLLPFVPTFTVPPDVILVGVLPPLLFSAAVQLPAIEFRRDFRTISGLAIVLVLGSALALGVFFWLVIPSVGFPLGVALGAILSPTDAVATSIAKRLGIAPRVTTILEGESLLNDATALVMLRTAIVAIAGSFSLWQGVGTFALGVVVAVIVGGIVGWLTMRLRAWVGSSAASAAISLGVPFLAYIPTEHLGGSGLVAAVVAGLVTGQRRLRHFSPEQRLADASDWRMIELVLEGAVFLVMGLELKDILSANIADHDGVVRGVWLAASALGILLLVRALFVTLQLLGQARRAKRRAGHRERLERVGERVDRMDATDASDPNAKRRERNIARFRTRLRRGLSDLDYYEANPLGWRHGVVVVWAGMRGVVTLAAAQTLPSATADRPLLIWVAFLVALSSLLLQGLTLPWVVRKLGLTGDAALEEASRDERARLKGVLRDAAASALTAPGLTRPDGIPFAPGLVSGVVSRFTAVIDDESLTERRREMLELQLISLDAQRRRLLDASAGGEYSSAALRTALAELDADQLSIERRLAD